jgi:hypothetical protein
MMEFEAGMVKLEKNWTVMELKKNLYGASWMILAKSYF